MILLEARSVAVTPPGAGCVAVSDVSLEVRAGEWLSITGANGSGKSSLSMALAGLWPVSAGEVLLRQAPLMPGDDAGRREVAVIFQDPASQLLQSTVRDELAFAARNLELPEAEIELEVQRLSIELGLSSDLERDPQSLSAGRQQRVLLAAALVAGPSILIADEPGAHLDAEGRARVLALVRERVRAGLAVVWVTQDDAEREAADREIRIGPPISMTPAPSGKIVAPGQHSPNGARLLEVRIGPAPEQGPAVRISGLSQLEIGVRGVHALTGSNGSGKTVLLSAIAGLIASPQIRVRWHGASKLAPIIATQYPELQIFEELVQAEITHAARHRGRAEANTQDILLQWLVGLVDDPAGFLERRCWTLSSGEKRVVAILGALLAPASIVLLDEPTAGLDSRLKWAIGALIAERSAEVPVLVATQDQDWVQSLMTPPR